MAGNKIFYVTRTEDEATQTAGAATKTRADKPQLLKIVGVDHAGNPNPATPEDNQIYATEEEKQEILLTSDTVQEGDLNPVTSDAVFHYFRPPHPDWSNAVAISTGQLKAGYTVPSDGMIVGYGRSAGNSSAIFSVNNVAVSLTEFYPKQYAAYSNTQVPVNKGDIFKSNSALESANFHFVPWK